MSDPILTLLLTYCAIVSIAVILGVGGAYRVLRLIAAIVALTALGVVVAQGARLQTSGNYFTGLLREFRSLNRTQLAAAGMGIALSLVWLTRLPSWWGRRREPVAPATSTNGAGGIEPLTQIVSLLVLIGCGLIYGRVASSPAGGERNLVALEPGYVAEEVAQLESPPVRVIVTDTGRVLLTQEKTDSGFGHGSVLELLPSGGGSRMEVRVLASSPLLYRPFGLAARGDEIYVSRSNHHVTASKGKVVFEPSGVITQLRDVDGDGHYEYFDDVAVGLPGMSGVNSQHQNNALVFGPDGRPYVAQGAGSNDREASVKEFEGKVLVFDADFRNPRIFASGFRNPFAMCVGPDGALFAVDNDVNQNPGDELDHLIEGEHYGHPYVTPAEKGRAPGFRDPVFVGNPESNLVGLAYGASDRLPEKLRGCFFITDRVKGTVLRLRLAREGDSYKVAEESVLARVPEPVDIAIAPDGTFYVTSHHRQVVYRIRPASGIESGAVPLPADL